jgi:hypothetical protein
MPYHFYLDLCTALLRILGNFREVFKEPWNSAEKLFANNYARKKNMAV